jgi:hypothetical protein
MWINTILQERRLMSQGLGAMQRDIMAVYDQGGDSTSRDVHWLRHKVAALRGTPKSKKFPERIYWWRFEASFSRALHTLIRRGILDAYPEPEYGRAVETVVRRKC